MADREVSWGDEEEVFVTPVVAPVASPAAAPVKKEMHIPEWSIDTRGDLPAEPSNSYGGKAVSPPVAAAAPGWPEEQDINSPHPLGRRVGRDPVTPRDSGYGAGRDNRDSGRGYTPRDNGPRDNNRDFAPRDSAPRDNGPRDTPRDNRDNRDSRNKGMNDLSTLKLPGVDLSKMPSATTGLSFSGHQSRDSRPPRREESSAEQNNDVYERVNRVVKEVEELGWGEPEESVPAPAKASIPSAYTAGSTTASANESLGWGDEPEPVKPVETIKPAETIKPVEAVKPAKTFKPVAQPAAQFAQKPAPVAAKIANKPERLEDDGWGDEPEEVHVPYVAPVVAPAVAAAPVYVAPAVTVTVAPPVVQEFKPVVVEAVKPAAPTPVVEEVKNVAPVAPVPSTLAAHTPAYISAPAALAASTSSEQMAQYHQQQSAFASYPSSHGHSQSMFMPMYGQMAPPMPYMMNQMHSPQQMGAPMNMMPGMMMPIWVACPFCHHCYMYPPVAPGSGPAPGAATASANNN